MADYFEITIIRGDTPTLRFSLTKGKQPLDLTDAVIRFTGKRSRSDADEVAQFLKMLSAGLTLVDAPTGVVDADFIKADTEALTERTIIYCDIQVTESDGNVGTPMYGKIIVEIDITRTS